MLTQWGPIHAEFTEKGLTELDFDDDPSHSDWVDSVFRKEFLEWLEAFQRRTNDVRWQYLAPQGTDFQKKVWRELLNVPIGQTTSYGELAEKIGQPKAARAVGSAVAANPICLLIPCHRVINTNGRSGNYRWGADRKLALLDAERASGSDLLGLFQ